MDVLGCDYQNIHSIKDLKDLVDSISQRTNLISSLSTSVLVLQLEPYLRRMQGFISVMVAVLREPPIQTGIIWDVLDISIEIISYDLRPNEV